MNIFQLTISVIPILFSLAIDANGDTGRVESNSPVTPCLAAAVDVSDQDLPENCTMDKDIDLKLINVCVDVTIVCEIEGLGTITIELDDEWCLF